MGLETGHDLEALIAKKGESVSKRKKKKASRLISLIAAGAAVVALYLIWQSRPGYSIEPGFATVQDAYRYRQTGIMAEVTGSVTRILQFDRDMPYVQKFVIRLPNGQSILVIHNRDRGGEVPLDIDDQVLVRGEYLWSETGGTIRNTERDMSTQRRHGWIDHEGKRYK